MEIKRDRYLGDLVSRKNNGLIKVVTGIRRCGKTFLVFNLFRDHLLRAGVDSSHVIALALDDDANKAYRDTRIHTRIQHHETMPTNDTMGQRYKPSHIRHTIRRNNQLQQHRQRRIRSIRPRTNKTIRTDNRQPQEQSDNARECVRPAHTTERQERTTHQRETSCRREALPV